MSHALAGRRTGRRRTADEEPDLTALLRDRPLRLSAELGPYRLEFDLAASADLGLQLISGYPVIIESYGQHRSARVHPERDELSLRDGAGWLSGARIADLSTTGLALELPTAGRGRIPDRFDTLTLRFPDGGELTLEARVARRDGVRAAGVGMEFVGVTRDQRQQLARYVFSRHPLSAKLPEDSGDTD